MTDYELLLEIDEAAADIGIDIEELEVTE